MHTSNAFFIYAGLIPWLFNLYKLDESTVVFGVVMLAPEGNTSLKTLLDATYKLT